MWSMWSGDPPPDHDGPDEEPECDCRDACGDCGACPNCDGEHEFWCEQPDWLGIEPPPLNVDEVAGWR